jgi:hypothetical protein
MLEGGKAIFGVEIHRPVRRRQQEIRDVCACVPDCAYCGELDMCERKRRKTHAVLRWEERQM